MLVRTQPLAFQWPSKRRIPWLLLSAALMFVSAYSVFGWMGAVGRIGGWTGLPQYQAEIPRLRNQAKVWSALAIALPFVAALLLGFGTRPSGVSTRSGSSTSLSYQAESRTEKWATPIFQYLRRLLISVLGTLGFVLCLFLIGLLLFKFGIRST
jgi:hypothetical protein